MNSESNLVNIMLYEKQKVVFEEIKGKNSEENGLIINKISMGSFMALTGS